MSTEAQTVRLKDIFNTFSNPATGSLAWIGAEQAEVIFLNDFSDGECVVMVNDGY